MKHYEFNNNIRCIEILYILLFLGIITEFNNNIRCIEILPRWLHSCFSAAFNNNIRCIEMQLYELDARGGTRLITT